MFVRSVRSGIVSSRGGVSNTGACVSTTALRMVNMCEESEEGLALFNQNSISIRGIKKHKPVQKFKNWKILRGDTVRVMVGKDKGSEGVVTQVLRKKNKVLVEGLNLVTKHVKSTPNQQGGIFKREAPIHISKVSLLDPVSNEPTRVKFGFLEDGTKVRIATQSGQILERPIILTERKSLRAPPSEKDTASDLVLKQTFVPTYGKEAGETETRE
eukprot:TRINITY_DN4004_c0_g1_i2.p1 TRINITY_DN4004_c0_g1~~TRINITY_DN4004_c0_g1_i2.p1  ORF type:complete len:214 (+),score=49.59 TRINITY_DN4004_c0_g1_i2:197-838(+)